MANLSNGAALGADQDPDATQDPSSDLISVTIADNGDGTFAVSLGDSDDAADSGAGQDTDDQPQQADSLDEALEMAGEMLSGGAAQGDESSGEGSDDSADGGGSDSAGDSSSDSAPMSASAAKSYWRQMAARKKPRGPM